MMRLQVAATSRRRAEYPMPLQQDFWMVRGKEKMLSRRTYTNSRLACTDIIPEKKEKMVQGIQVRSQQLPVITKQALQQKVLKALSDLGIGARPNMPTGQVCSKYEQLHHSIVYLVELRKTVEKMESDHQSKLQRRQGGAGFGGRATSSSSRDKRRK